MPYPAIWTRSQRGQISADYESVAFPGNTFIFLQKRRTQQCSFFRCAHCAKAMKLRGRRNATRLTVPIVRATLEDGFLDDPDNPLHRHFCIDEDGVDTSTFAAKARYIYNKVKLELLDMPMTPRQAWLQMKAEVIANFPDPTTQEEIISRLPSDKSAKRSFARRSSVGKRNLVGELAIISGLADEDMFGFLDGEEGEGDEDAGRMFELVQEDPRNIPLDLLKPSSQRPSWVCAPGREHLSNFFLIYRDFPLNGAPFMIFSDMMGINLLHKCPDIVCDGNSNFYPRGFSQLYTFHAVHESIPEEAHLCAFALLPNTAPITYLKLFDIISERLVIEYGEHGVKKNWHFDNQFAAINGCQAIFQTDNVEGSEERTASFAQLWHEHLHCLFFESHPNLINFIQVMRDELARASAQAERIFPPSTTVKAINLDNIEAVNRFGEIKKQEEEQLFALNYPPTGGYHRQALLERHRFGTGAVFYNYPDLFVPPFYEQPRRGRPRKYPRDANGRPIRTPIQQQQFQAVTHRIRRPKVTWLPLAADKKEEEEEDSQQPCTSASAGLKPASPPPQLVAAAEKASTNATSSFSSMATGNGKRQQQQPPVRKRPKIILQRVVVMENGVAEVEQPTEEDQQVEVDVEQLEPTVIEGLGKSNSLRGLGLQQQQQPAASSSAMPSRGMSNPAKEGNKTVAKRS